MQPNTFDDEDLHGSMDINTQAETYHTVMIGLRYVILAIAISASLLISVFCTAAGWGVGLFVGFIELVIGLYFAKDRNQNTWQSGVASLIITTEGETGQPVVNHARLGIQPTTFTMWAISAVIVTIVAGAAAALFPHAR